MKEINLNCPATRFVSPTGEHLGWWVVHPLQFMCTPTGMHLSALNEQMNNVAKIQIVIEL